MSKFEELCEFFNTSVDHYIKYRDDCHDFSASFFNDLKEYLDIPPDSLKIYPPGDEIDFTHGYNLLDAMILEDDTFWHFRIGITLAISSKPPSFPSRTFLINVLVKKTDEYFEVRLGDAGGPEFKMTLKPDFTPAYDLIYGKLKEYLENGLERFLKQDMATIGFKV